MSEECMSEEDWEAELERELAAALGSISEEEIKAAQSELLHQTIPALAEDIPPDDCYCPKAAAGVLQSLDPPQHS